MLARTTSSVGTSTATSTSSPRNIPSNSSAVKPALQEHGLADGGQVGERGEWVVVDADDRDVVRDAQARPTQCAQGAHGDLVGVGVHGGGW